MSQKNYFPIQLLYVISQERFVYLFFFPHWFAVGGHSWKFTRAPNWILQYLIQNLMTVGELFVYGVTVNKIWSNHTHAGGTEKQSFWLLINNTLGYLMEQRKKKL